MARRHHLVDYRRLLGIEVKTGHHVKHQRISSADTDTVGSGGVRTPPGSLEVNDISVDRCSFFGEARSLLLGEHWRARTVGAEHAPPGHSRTETRQGLPDLPWPATSNDECDVGIRHDLAPRYRSNDIEHRFRVWSRESVAAHTAA
jgi:hypothetical protein